MNVPLTNNSVRLSREELMYVLALFKTDFILGLDLDPMGELTKEQMKIGFIYSERALRARNLATVDIEGNLQINSTLFALIETCAYPEFSLALHKFSPSKGTQQAFWHKREGLLARHTKPSVPLHLFDFVVEDEFINDVVSACDVAVFSDDEYLPVEITNKSLAKIKDGELSEEAVTSLLTDIGANENSAQELGTLLANEHDVIALHAVFEKEDKELEKRKLTVLGGATSVWVAKDLSDEIVEISSVSEKALLSALLQLIHFG